ncbi:MAG: SPOR domain-containing protein [Methylococcaceae bacterium]|jgi:cell division protein FtsN
MPKDLKHRIPAFRARRKIALSRWFMACIGLTVISVALIVGVGRQKKTAADSSAAPQKVSTPTAPPSARISFFQLLPDSERQISDADIKAELNEIRLGKTARSGAYLLQTGAFTEQAEAESLREDLQRLTKTRPRLELIKMEYATWFRVMLGPYKTLVDVDKVRSFLREHQIDSIVQTSTHP